jgi:hypothetical protein
MLEELRDMETDFISFSSDEEEGYMISGSKFSVEKFGEPIDVTSVGPSYHILLFKWGEDKPIHIDSFEAVFADIREYISNLLPQFWCGYAVKKTTKSEPIIRELLDKVTEAC